MLDELIDEFCRRNELSKRDDDYIVSDDTQVGIEFAYEKMLDGNQLISEKAIKYLFDNHPEAYKEFYERVSER